MKTVDETVRDLLGKDLTLCRDYASIVNWSVGQIKKWTDDWTDYSITDPGVLFINADAFQYDILNFVLDKSYLNNILRLTRSEQSLYFMSLFVGLELPAYESSEAVVRVINNSSQDFTLLKDFSVYVDDKATGNSLWFYNLADTYIPANNYADTNMIEGKRSLIKTTFGDFDEHYSFHIPIDNIGLNTLTVSVQMKDSEEMTELVQVDDALLNLSTEMCFSVHRGYNQTYVKLPPGSWEYLDEESLIYIQYGVTTGEDSNMGKVEVYPADVIPLNDEFKKDVKFLVLKAEGGKSPYDLENTRIYIGDNSWRVDTLVTEVDYNKILNGRFNNEVIRISERQEQGIEVAHLFFLPEEGLSKQRILELEQEITEAMTPYMFGFIQPIVQVMSETRLFFQFEVVLSTNTSDTSFLEKEINEILHEYFDRRTQEKRMTMRRNAILGMIELLHEVEYAICISPVSDMQVNDNEFFTVGNVTIEFKQKG